MQINPNSRPLNYYVGSVYLRLQYQGFFWFQEDNYYAESCRVMQRNATRPGQLLPGNSQSNVLDVMPVWPVARKILSNTMKLAIPL